MAGSAKSKEAWNKAHYSQVKISVSAGLAEKFRDRCASRGMPMARVLSGAMLGFVGEPQPAAPRGLPGARTRKARRAAFGKALSEIERVLEDEREALDNTLENFRETDRYIESARIVEALEAAIGALEDVY